MVHWSNTIHKVLNCMQIKRSLSAHENTLVVLCILYLCSLITESKEPLSSHKKIKIIMPALGSSNFEDSKITMTTLKNALCNKNLVDKKGFKSIKNNTFFQFLMKHIDMVNFFSICKCLSWSKDWLAHLNTLEKIITYFTEMNRISYRRMLSVYWSDMRPLEEK